MNKENLDLFKDLLLDIEESSNKKKEKAELIQPEEETETFVDGLVDELED